MTELMTQAAAVAVTAALCAAVVRRGTPEIALVLVLAAGVWVLLSAAEGLTSVAALMEELAQLAGLDRTVVEPVFKTVVLSILTKLTGEVCRSAGEGGLASAVEIAGTVLALAAALDGGDAGMRRMICVLMVLLPFLVLPALGAELSFPQVDELFQEAEGYGVTETDGLGQGVQSILETGLDQVGSLLQHSLQTGLKLLAVVLLCGLAESAALDGKAGGLKAVEVAGALAVTALTVSDMKAMIGLGRETIQQMDAFAGLLLPAMATLTAATGGVTGAAVRQGVLLYAYVAACCAQAALGNEGLKKLSALIKGAITFLLTAGLLVFVGYLAASGAIAGSADAAAVKAAKLAISRAVPVVGGILSDAAETVLAGAGVLRGTVGVVGTLVVLAICPGGAGHLHRALSPAGVSLSDLQGGGGFDRHGGGQRTEPAHGRDRRGLRADSGDDGELRPDPSVQHRVRGLGGGLAMMELLRAWLTGITAAAILCALANSLMPEGAVRRVGKLACGLVMLSAILRPLVEVEALSPGDLLDDYQAQAAIQTQELEEERNTALKSIIEQEFAAYIVDKADQLGAACTAQVTCQLGEGGVFLPQSAAVQGSFTPQQQEELARILEEELAIPRARQSFLTKEEEESP